jgi:hypothetical protein
MAWTAGFRERRRQGLLRDGTYGAQKAQMLMRETPVGRVVMTINRLHWTLIYHFAY